MWRGQITGINSAEFLLIAGTPFLASGVWATTLLTFSSREHRTSRQADRYWKAGSIRKYFLILSQNLSPCFAACWIWPCLPELLKMNLRPCPPFQSFQATAMSVLSLLIWHRWGDTCQSSPWRGSKDSGHGSLGGLQTLYPIFHHTGLCGKASAQTESWPQCAWSSYGLKGIKKWQSQRGPASGMTFPIRHRLHRLLKTHPAEVSSSRLHNYSYGAAQMFPLTFFF